MILSLVGALFVSAHDVNAQPQQNVQRSVQIALVVNESPITFGDIQDRMALIMRSSGLQPTPDVLRNLQPQVITALIDERIRVQEAERLELEVSQGEINEGFAKLAASNNFEAQQFREILARTGINISTLYDQIRSQLAWVKVVQSQLRPQVNVSDIDVQNTLDRIEGNKGKAEYLVAEILLPVEDRADDGKVLKLAQDLSREMQAGRVPFSRVAQQFSKSAGASSGGDLGWVQEGQLDDALDLAIRQTQVGEISAPVRSLNGYHIFLVRNQRVISDETMPSRSDIFNTLGQKRLENIARRYFLDLKTSAFIDNRLES